MKKFVAVISILALLFCLVSAFAEGIDLKGLSDDELLALKDSVMDEISERSISIDYDFSPGIYLVNRDIKAGDYNLHFSNVEDKILLFIYNSSSDRDNSNPLYTEIIKDPERDYHIHLEDGMVFEMLQYGEADIKISIQDNLPWKP